MNEGDLTDEQVRDWYAGVALQGLLAFYLKDVNRGHSEFAKAAFDIAEAMMKERKLRRIPE